MTDQERYYARVRQQNAEDTYPVLTVGIHPANVTALAVFRHCEWSILTGGLVAVMRGISALELRAAMELEDVPADRVRDTAARVRIMERTQAVIYRDRAEAEREKIESERKNRGAR